MMRVRKVMQTPVTTMAAQTPLQQALNVLEGYQTAHIPGLKEQVLMQYGRLVVPTNFSPTSTQAVSKALYLARQHHASLVMLHVLTRANTKFATDIDHGAAEIVAQLVEEAHAEARKRLASLVPPDMAAQVTYAVVGGDPAREIVHAAARHQADLLVMGHSRRRGVWKFIMPSVIKYVTRHAPCPVLVVAGQADYELVGR